MIEKLPFEITKGEYEGKSFDIKAPTSQYDMQEKINELCDVVNEQQKQIDQVSCAILDLATPNGENKALESIKAKTPVDPYAEQRWVGCLCRFWQGSGSIATYGVLGEILPDSDLPYYKKDTDTYWKHCELVKPDDDIIYKGE